MNFKEIKGKIKTSNPGEIIDLAKNFDRLIDERQENIAFRNFRAEYFSDITDLKFTRDPENAALLDELVSIAIDIERNN